MISKEMVNNIKKALSANKADKSILTVIVYGSWARGTNDEISDIDILVLCEFCNDTIIEKIEKAISGALQDYKTDISIYDLKRFQILLECGSLFLHHIYDEGVIIYSCCDKYNNKNYLFGKLRDFKGISEDILLYKRMLDKTEISIKENYSNYFDINMLALLTRNTMILICYYAKRPQYGKLEVYETCCDIMGENIMFNKREYTNLMQYRAYYNRKNTYIELLSEEECACYIRKVKLLIEQAMKIMDIKNSIDRLFYLFNDNPGHNFYTSYEVFTDFDRDLYIALNKYMNKNYNIRVDSITKPFIEELFQDYINDSFVQCVYKVIFGVTEIKKRSSNYSIDCPDVFTKTDIRYMEKFNNKDNELLSFLYQYAFFRKIICKFYKVEKQDIINDINNLRELIRDELTDE